MSLKTVCAWCQKYLEGSQRADAPVTHGICPPCSDRMRETAGLEPKWDILALWVDLGGEG